MSTDACEILRNAAVQALKHLDAPDPDTDTIARQLEQSARLVLTGGTRPGAPHTVDELVARYSGHSSTTPRDRAASVKPGLSDEDIAKINRLRPTHTLKELSEMFDRHPSVILKYCETRVDLRGTRHARATA